MAKLTKAHKAVLQRMADGWTPLWSQLDGAHRRKLEGAGLIKADYGEPGTPDENRLQARLTPAGRAALSGGSDAK